MNRYQEIAGRINYWMFLVIAVLLPFPQIPLRYACAIWFVTWLLEGRWLRRPLPLKEHKEAIPFLLFGLWFGYKLLSYFWAPDYVAWARQMERYILFGLLIPVGIWGVNDNYDWRQIGKFFITSCVIALPLYFILLVELHFHREWVPYFPGEDIWTPFDSWWTSVYNNISRYKHRLFLCSTELFGVAVALQLWKKKNQWLSAILVPIMLSSIIITSSRQAILTAAAMLVVGILNALPRVYRWRYGVAILLLGVVIGSGLLSLNPRMQTVDLSAIKDMRQLSYNHDIRLNIYGAAIQQPTDYIAYGLGAGQSQNYIAKMMDTLGFHSLAELKFHPHNQYLEELMEAGIGGLLLFLLAWLSVPLCTKGNRRRMAWLFITLYLFNMFTDCMFAKFDGIALWVFAMVLIYRIDPVDKAVSDPPTLA